MCICVCMCVSVHIFRDYNQLVQMCTYVHGSVYVYVLLVAILFTDEPVEICICVYVLIVIFLCSVQIWCDTRSIFKLSWFKFRVFNQPYLPIAEGGSDGFMTFTRALAQSEMQTI